MRTKTAGFLLSLSLASAAFGQATVARTYTVTHAASQQEFQEIGNLIRVITGININPAQGQTLAAAGTAERVGIADFLFNELDQPPQTQSNLPHVYTVSPDDVVRVFYLPPASSIQDFQEINNGVRTIALIRLAFGDNAQHALVLRGTPAQIAFAEFLLNDLAQPTHTAGTHSYQVTTDDVIQVFYLPHAATVQDFQEIANMIRTIGDIRGIMAINAPRAVVVRATPSQVALAAWLVNEFEQPAAAPAAPNYGVGADDFVRVFYFPRTGTTQDFQAAANAIRTTAQIRRAVAIGTPRAFTVRGTTSQLDLAQRLVTDLSKPQ